MRTIENGFAYEKSSSNLFAQNNVEKFEPC